MKEETRKVQLTGGSTLTVSLPIKWAREAGIKQGDEISLIQRSDKSLVLTPTKKEGWKFKSAELELSTAECFEDNFRYLIAYYLVGYDLVRLLTPSGFKAEERKRIKEEVRKRLIGMEVVGESSREIVLQSFLKYEDFTLRDAIRSMSEIILSMQGDAISTLENRDPKLAEDVAERDNEVDRFYLLIVRQLKAAMSDPELAKKIGVGRQRDSLGYRIVVKSMERIGDHVENIARNSLFPSSLSVSSLKVLEGVKEAGSRAERLFAKTLSSLSEIDLSQREAMKTANETIRDANALVAELERLNERVLAETEEELSVTDKIQVLSILDSLGRIAKYCTDIAEVTINMSTKIAGEWAF
ncbi:MAG: PhoU domain-containing protein [Candidatus Methanospirareceae archaeon]|nr:AbrB/MazE/SpoVT family DNA-binding domain-containing protein [Methanophagales archaeon]HDN68114.1 phosphate uptake regulator PhoU [Methanomicrobia archaeon]